MGKFVSSYGRGTGKPSPVDVHVGARVRMRRAFLGMSQTKLGDAIGLTFQQVQKYERGANRIGSSRLFDLSRVLDVPVEFFFEDMPRAVAASSPGRRPRKGKHRSILWLQRNNGCSKIRRKSPGGEFVGFEKGPFPANPPYPDGSAFGPGPLCAGSPDPTNQCYLLHAGEGLPVCL